MAVVKDSNTIWSFNYKKGPAPLSAHVRARDEETAMAVAARWCRSQNARPPAKVFPFIVADESILEVAEGPEVALTANAVQATTGMATVKV